VNRALGAEALTWEATLAENRRAARIRAPVHMGYPYVSVVRLLVGAGYAAIALGTYYLFSETKRRWGADVAIATAAGIASAAAIGEIAFIHFFLGRWKGATPAPGDAADTPGY
jgi:hypothetical protein